MFMSTPALFALTFASIVSPSSIPALPPQTPPLSFGAEVRLQPEFSSLLTFENRQVAPRSGGQLYLQRLAALQTGKLYTRLPSDSFSEVWAGAMLQPKYGQWRKLLAMEARAVASRKNDRALSILLGDSLSLWFPGDRLPQNHLWLNQGISGDTTWNILARLRDTAKTRPSEIYVMAGVNDLKVGASDAEILWNLGRIVKQLRSMHPNAKIIVQSILPTRSSRIPNERIVGINQELSTMAQKSGVSYLDLYAQFSDRDGQIMPQYTTDGIHLTAQGYAAWQTIFRDDTKVAQLEQNL